MISQIHTKITPDVSQFHLSHLKKLFHKLLFGYTIEILYIKKKLI